MRYLERITPLPKRVNEALDAYQRELDRRLADVPQKKTRSDMIDKYWGDRRSSKTLEAVEIALKAMASGIERCMYCDEGHGHQIEHFRPKADYSAEAFNWDNLLWVCGECNTQKNRLFDDQIVNPTLDDPFDHLELAFREGRFLARKKSVRGKMTLERLRRLDEQNLIKGRKSAFDLIQVLLEGFPKAGKEKRAQIRNVIVNAPFGSVFAAILRASHKNDAAMVLGPSIPSVLTRYPEIYDWLNTADLERRANALVEIQEIAHRIGVPISELEKMGGTKA